MSAPALHLDPLARIAELAEALDAHNGRGDVEMSQQVLKIVEETGEAASAWLGYTGQNPRKGITHTRAELFAELADVATAALVTIARLGGDPRAELDAKTAIMAARYAALPVLQNGGRP